MSSLYYFHVLEYLGRDDFIISACAGVIIEQQPGSTWKRQLPAHA
jgi:hypothetical protein